MANVNFSENVSCDMTVSHNTLDSQFSDGMFDSGVFIFFKITISILKCWIQNKENFVFNLEPVR